jgi:hypothetical protein
MPFDDNFEPWGQKNQSPPAKTPPRPQQQPGNAPGPVDPAKLQSRLANAINRITVLEEQVSKLLAALVLTQAGDVEIRAAGALKLTGGAGGVQIKDAVGNGLTMGSFGIDLQGTSKINMAAAAVKLACGMLTVDSGMSKFSGVVKSDTVITNTVIASTYTPGAGNIW